MKWRDFLNSILTEKQIEVLRYALKVNAKVYFYGEGLGKSTIVNVLKSLGYTATEPGEMPDRYATYCPDGSDYICFNVKGKTPEELIPRLWDILKGQKKEIVDWINR